MVRPMVAVHLTTLLAATLAVVLRAEEPPRPAPRPATVIAVDPQGNTITLRILGQDGKPVERTFALSGDTPVYAGAARVTRTNKIRVGGVILAVERHGKLAELRLPDEPAPPAAGRAIVADVDPEKKTITLRMADASGRQVERTFRLTGDLDLYDEAGKVAQLGLFKLGRVVLATERGSELMELRLPGAPADKPARPPGHP